MSCDYHNRVDFRAFDVMVYAIDHATKADLQAALKTAQERSTDASLPHTTRQIWGDFESLIRRQVWKF